MLRTETKTLDWRATVDDLAAALRGEPEFVAFIAAQERLQSDREAQRVIREWQEAQRTAQRFGGFFVETSSPGRLRQAEQALRANPAVQCYLTAQETLQTLLREVAGLISEHVGFNFGLACAPAGGCCG